MTLTAPSDRDPGDFARLSGGAPRVSSPTGNGKMVTYRRPSGFAVEPNTYNLMTWKERQLVMGLLTLLGDEVHALDLDDRDAIDRLINDSYDASDTSLAADRGTFVHALTEYIDRTGQVPQ